MIFSGQSDLAASIGLRSHNSRIRTALDIASSELATGLKDNLSQATAGDLGKLFAIDRTLLQLSTENNAALLALGKSSLTQLTLGHIHDDLVSYGPELLSAVERGDQQSMRLIGLNAKNLLASTMSSLNSRYGRHSVFAGAAVDQPALSSANDLLVDISGIIAGAVDASSALTAIDDYFYSPGGGFEVNIYLGADQDAPPFRDLSGGEINYAVRGDAIIIRQTLRALSIAAIATDAPNFTGTQDQIDLLNEAALSAISATGDIVETRANLGYSEATIADTQARNHAKFDLFEQERLAILSADPYEAVTRFEALQGQLQTVYMITARLSDLTLTNFLR